MANTYQLITSNVLSAATASVTLSAIPATYTDLLLRVSGRVNRAVNIHNCSLTVNGSSTSDYSRTSLAEFGVTINSTRDSAQTSILVAFNGTSTTSDTFTNNEYYFPNYAGSTNKPISVFEVVENNSTTDLQSKIGVTAGLRSNTAAVTSITLNAGSFDYMIGSSFYLYGIKNS